MVKITLPFPDARLAPNRARSLHWAEKGSIAKDAREQGYFFAAETQSAIKQSETIPLYIVFYPPNKRRRDLDNLLASMKPYLDGICDYLKIDDHSFSPITIEWGEITKGGKVEVCIGIQS